MQGQRQRARVPGRGRGRAGFRDGWGLAAGEKQGKRVASAGINNGSALTGQASGSWSRGRQAPGSRGDEGGARWALADEAKRS